ncbi:MAG: hypothetical protein K2G38_04300, partial [Clostridia bacterium]|nr:hypothetical protein [Clostridia bacterium]
YDDGTDDGDSKLANLDEFIASVDDFSRLNPNATLDEYLNQVTLATDVDNMDDGDYVTIATIHSVKGLEFPCVFICGLEDGIMPSSRTDSIGREAEEERRLMYVAITRAEKNLYLTRSKSRYLYGHRDLTRPSRFIAELAPELGIQPIQSPYAYGGGRYQNNYRESSYGGGGGRALYSSADGFESDIPVKTTSAFKPSFGSAKSNPVGGKKDYSVGLRVRHPKFGVGMIIAVKNGGTVLNVAFDGQGIKELSASIAPLEII